MVTGSSPRDLDSGKRRYLLRTIGRFRDLDSLRELIVAERNGAIVRLRDVARVELDHAEPRSRSFTDGEAAPHRHALRNTLSCARVLRS